MHAMWSSHPLIILIHQDFFKVAIPVSPPLTVGENLPITLCLESRYASDIGTGVIGLRIEDRITGFLFMTSCLNQHCRNTPCTALLNVDD